MPFKVSFRIFEPGKTAPCYETSDRSLAYVEWNDRRRKDALVRMVPEVTYIAGPKHEEYVWLVYRVVKAIRKYYDERDHVSKDVSSANLQASLALEKELDDWNARTRRFLDSHSKVMDGQTTRRYLFFILVEAWRKRWHEYFAYKKQAGRDPKWEKKLRDDCFAMEKEIKNYIRKVIGL